MNGNILVKMSTEDLISESYGESQIINKHNTGSEIIGPARHCYHLVHQIRAFKKSSLPLAYVLSTIILPSYLKLVPFLALLSCLLYA
jgi:hypothetical protein